MPELYLAILLGLLCLAIPGFFLLKNVRYIPAPPPSQGTTTKEMIEALKLDPWAPAPDYEEDDDYLDQEPDTY